MNDNKKTKTKTKAITSVVRYTSMHLTLVISITFSNLVGVLNITILAGHPQMFSKSASSHATTGDISILWKSSTDDIKYMEYYSRI